MNNNQTAMVNCVGISASIGVSKLEPSTKPNASKHLDSRQLRQQLHQKYTNLRRERLKPARVSTTSAQQEESASAAVSIKSGKKQNSKNGNFESYTISRQLDKKQRFDLFMKRLNLKPSVSSSEQAIKLLNDTIVEVEDRYAPQKSNKFYAVNSKRYGRMHPIPNERIKLNEKTGVVEVFSVGLVTYIHPNGYFEMWTAPRGLAEPKRIFKKNALPPPPMSLDASDENASSDEITTIHVISNS